MQPRAQPALHRPKFHFAQPHSSTRHELILVRALPAHGKLRRAHLRRQCRDSRIAHIRPRRRRPDSRRHHQSLPKSLRHPRHRTPRRHLLLQIFLPRRRQLFHQRLPRVLRREIHHERELVIHRPEVPRAPRRELQNSRAAHTPVRHQQGSALLQLHPAHARLHAFDRHTRQPLQPRILRDIERKERRHRRLDLVPQRPRHRQPRRRFISAGRDQHPVRRDAFARRELKLKARRVLA